MRDELKSCLEDILYSISLIEIFLEGTTSFENYRNNLLVKNAVERRIEIIGEALNNALKLDPTLNISHSRKIVDMRNKLIHAYDEVDDTVVWNSVKKYIPILKNEVQTIFNS